MPGKLTQSSIGLKIIVAVTGIALFGFVIVHMLGNWQLFAGQNTINTYAALLKHNPQILWPARIGLLIIFTLHVGATIRLKRRSRLARPDSYVSEDTLAATWASRHMMLTGLLLLAFILFHLAHYTLMLVDPSFAHLHDPKGRHDVYSMVVLGFSQPIISGLYILAMLFLGLHLSHGLGSVFQTLGFNNVTWRPRLQTIARLVALLIVLGNIAMPIAVLAGYITLPPGVGLP